MFDGSCATFSGYNPCIGSAIGWVVVVLLIAVGVADLVLTFRRSPRPSQMIAEYLELWSSQHPVSATLLAFLLGAMVSHFFWSTGHPGPWPW